MILDYYIHNELISGDSVYNEDGLSFKVVDINTNEILAVFSLATSGIIWKVDSFTKVLPAIKVDIMAVDKKYQKLHMDKLSYVYGNLVSWLRDYAQLFLYRR